jgi:16S rRNA (cytidine1402-2'-O)-methyltransferase
MPALYVVATPIGNLEDITFRAIRILKEVKLIAAEDTRKTRILLSHYGITTRTTSYHEHNKLTKLDYLIDLLRADDVALVSDAGTPGISDPGYELILAVHQHNIPVIPIPGPSVLISAVAISGLPTNNFHFFGFLAHKASERRRLLKAICEEADTLVFFESPHRIPESLTDMLDILGDRRVAICRELTKMHEEVFRGTLSQAKEHFTLPRGEFTIVVSGKIEVAAPVINSEITDLLRRFSETGITAKEATQRIAEQTGLSRKELYQAWIDLKK